MLSCPPLLRLLCTLGVRFALQTFVIDRDYDFPQRKLVYTLQARFASLPRYRQKSCLVCPAMHHEYLKAILIHSRFVSLPNKNTCVELVHGLCLATNRMCEYKFGDLQ